MIFHSAIFGFWRGLGFRVLLASVVLGLVVSGLGVVLPGGARAQSPGVVEVPADWALIPSGLAAGDEFRLLFLTSTKRDATSSNIADYDSFVQARVAAGHAAIQEYSTLFKVVGSTATVDARDHIMMNPNNSAHPDVPVYWLGGLRVAANTAGFWSTTWENWAEADRKQEFGQTVENDWQWTGTKADGTKADQYLGASPNVMRGRFQAGVSDTGPMQYIVTPRGQLHTLYSISPVFRVANPIVARFDASPSYSKVYEGERKVIAFEVPGESINFSVAHLSGISSGDYRIYYPHDAATPLSGTSWKGMISNGLVKFGLEARIDGDNSESGEALRVRLRTATDEVGTADIEIANGERPLSLLFRVQMGSSSEWVETDRPSVTLHEGGAGVSYQIRLSGEATGYSSARVHIMPNIWALRHVYKIPPGPSDDDRFIFRDPSASYWGNDTRTVVGPGGWRTVTFAAGQDDDAFGHSLTLYHRVSPGSNTWNEEVDPHLLKGPDSRGYSQLSYSGPRLPGCQRYVPDGKGKLKEVTCWTWPILVRIVDDDKWEQELVFARHDPDAGDDGGPGDWVLASDGGLRKALPTALAPGSEYTFYIRLAVDPATLPKNDVVQRNVTVTEGGVTKQVDIYPPTFLPDSIFVGASVEGRSDSKGISDVRLLVSPNGARYGRDIGTYYLTDTSGQREHPSVEADYNYRDNTSPGAKGTDLFWDEPIAVTVVVADDASTGVSRHLRVSTPWGIHSRPGARYGWSYREGLDINISDVEVLEPRAQWLSRNFHPRTPEEILEYVKQVSFDNDGEEGSFVPFADVIENRDGISDGARSTIIEGETARFTVFLTPPPVKPRAVTVNVARRDGSTPLGLNGHLGVRTVMVPPSGSVQFEIPTADNDDVGDNGYLYVTVVSNPTYRVSAFGGVAEMDVLSDDTEAVYDAVRVQRVTDSGATIVWDLVPGATSYEVVWLEGTSTNPQTLFTADTFVEFTGLSPNSGYSLTVLDDWWNRVGSVEFQTLKAGGGEKFYPVLNVTADGDITEGGMAPFTVTASPAPVIPLTVPLWVSQRGNYAAGGVRGERSVTIPTSGSVSFEVATVDDAMDELDGAIIATLERSRLGYMLGSDNRAEVSVVDNDEPQPEISISASGPVTEGDDVRFFVVAAPRPSEPLTVNVTVAQVGDFGISTGSQTVTVPTSGSAIFTVATDDDDNDEPHGLVSVDVDTGDGYSISAVQSRVTVSVVDNDEPQPEISISASGPVTEGGDALFTVSASPVPVHALSVSVSVSEQGDFGVVTGSRTVIVPTS
ncbi:MAG: hypothetical protein F4X48_06720, partial [Acidimicrobiia bacterium]|nr:hypothetical protein [Acidimicrobiia bacterium]